MGSTRTWPTTRRGIAAVSLFALVVTGSGCDGAPAPLPPSARPAEPTQPAHLLPWSAIDIDIAALELLTKRRRSVDCEFDDVARAYVAAGERGMLLLEEALRSGNGFAARGATLCLAARPREALPVLLRRMQDPEARTRQRAASALARCADWWSGSEFEGQVIDAVLAGTDTATQEGRFYRRVLLAAASRPDERVVAALGELLRVAEPEELDDVARVVEALRAAARPLVPVLVSRLESAADGERSGPDAVLSALRAVGPDDAAVAAVERLLRRPEQRIRAINVLADWGDAASAALPAIEEAASSPDHAVSAAAGRALCSMRAGAVRGVALWVARTAQGGPAYDSGWYNGLRSLDDRADVVLGWVEDGLRSGAEPRAKKRALVSLLTAVDPARFPKAAELCLEALRSGEPEVSTAAAEVLVGPGFRAVLTEERRAELLSHRHAAVRLVALRSTYGGIKGRRDPAIAARLVAFLRDPDPGVVRLAGNLIDDNDAPPPDDPVLHSLADLRLADRDRRDGILRALRPLGPAARWAAPEMIRAAADPQLAEPAFRALGATGELDAKLENAVFELVADDPKQLRAAIRELGPRGDFLQDLGRDAILRSAQPPVTLRQLAAGAADPAEFLAWMVEHERELNPEDFRFALMPLGVVGLHRLVASPPPVASFHVFNLVEHVRKIGEPAVDPLDEIVRRGSPSDAAVALRLLAEVFPKHATRSLLRGAESSDPAVRAAALRGACDVVRAGVPPRPFADAASAALDDEPAVRAAGFELLSLLPDVSTADLERARAALADASPDVRVAAAAAVFARTKDARQVLPVLRMELALPPSDWGWGDIGHAPARPTDDYDPDERTWVAVARVLGSIGPDAASLAEDLAWAAVRHGEPGVQRRMIEVLASMGPAASGAARLVAKLPAQDEDFLSIRHGDDGRELVATRDRVLRAIAPQPR